MTIYTKNGDEGHTGLYGTATQFSKADPIFEILGSLDEFNSVLGLLHASPDEKLVLEVQKIQAYLLELGSFVAGKEVTSLVEAHFQTYTQYLEQRIDYLEGQTSPLKSFILPGGSLDGAVLHHARSVARRTERVLVAYLEKCQRTKLLFAERLLNRLSDFLFAYARFINQNNKFEEITWKSQL